MHNLDLAKTQACLQNVTSNKRRDMDMYKILTFLIAFIFLTSCSEPTVNENSVDPDLPWTRISIRLYRQAVHVIRDDTARFRTWQYKDSIGAESVIHNPVDQREVKFLLSRDEQDSLYKYCYEVITKPVFIDSTVSCFHCPNIGICIKGHKSSICCSYGSVPSWRAVSPTLEKVYRLLRTKVDLNADD